MHINVMLYFDIVFMNKISILTTLTENFYIISGDDILSQSKMSILKGLTKFIAQNNKRSFNKKYNLFKSEFDTL